MIRLVGIDPGLKGAVAVVDLHQDGQLPHLLSVTGTPTLTYKTRKKQWRREYDVPSMHGLLTAAASSPNVRIAGVYLERQGARPGQGVTSTFSTGVGFGLWRGLIAACGLPLMTVQPQVWRRVCGLGKGKAASLRVVLERFPTQFPAHLRRHDGAADAVLLAYFGFLQTRTQPGNDPMPVADRGLEGRVDPGPRSPTAAPVEQRDP
jgi:crossover junction endodeoxyribonuclease RuvC